MIPKYGATTRKVRRVAFEGAGDPLISPSWLTQKGVLHVKGNSPATMHRGQQIFGTIVPVIIRAVASKFRKERRRLSPKTATSR